LDLVADKKPSQSDAYRSVRSFAVRDYGSRPFILKEKGEERAAYNGYENNWSLKDEIRDLDE